MRAEAALRTAYADLHVEVQGGNIVVTLPGTSYAVTYLQSDDLSAVASLEVPLGPNGGRLPDDASRVSRSTTRRASWGRSCKALR
jgi:hypothetical protein